MLAKNIFVGQLRWHSIVLILWAPPPSLLRWFRFEELVPKYKLVVHGAWLLGWVVVATAKEVFRVF